jgi:16S rRNA (cytidine1402-2'-O)-methyltransferase
MGLMSDAGCPGVADPGAELVKLAHELGFKVEPLVGPNSIILALMASGLNGQSFAFNGYLPREQKDRIKKIQWYERIAKQQKQTQLFIETPYRNLNLFEDLLNELDPNTMLCVAADITSQNEFIKSMPVYKWKKEKPDINKKPAVFLFL